MVNRTVVAMGVLGLIACAGASRTMADEGTIPLRENVQSTHKRIETIVIRENLVERAKEVASEPGHAARRFTNAMREEREHALSAIDASDEGKVAEIEEKYDKRMDKADDLEKTVRRNRNVSIRRTHWIDFAASRHCLQDTDTRPIDDIMAEEGIDESMRPTLSRTLTLFADTQSSTRLMVEADKLAVIAQSGTFDADKAWLSIGVVPAWVFGEEFKVSSEKPDGKETSYSVTYLPENRIVARFVTRPDMADALARWSIHDRNGSVLLTMRFENHRNIGGFWLPSRTTIKRSLYGLTDFHVTVLNVESAQLGVQVHDELFEVPEGYHVQDTRSAGP